MADRRALARAVVRRHGRTFAEDAGIRLEDKPSPLYQLSVLALLLSARISSRIAVAAATELFRDGLRSARAMAEATWQRRVDDLGRGHYRRYDERTSTQLGNGAKLLLDRWHGDLRRLHQQADGDLGRLRAGLKELPGIGDTGADLFLREAQVVWPDLRPFVDNRAARGAAEIGLPTDPDELARLVPEQDLPRLVVGLVRVTLDRSAAEQLRGEYLHPVRA